MSLKSGFCSNGCSMDRSVSSWNCSENVAPDAKYDSVSSLFSSSAMRVLTMFWRSGESSFLMISKTS